jgi:5S rRNA maturation endonuclease (ribonuclease M5)
MMADQIRDVLSEVGYTLYDFGQYFRARPLYRESDNNTVLSINKETGKWLDFKTQQGGSLEDLVRVTLKLEEPKDAKEYVSSRIAIDRTKEIPKPKVKTNKIFDFSLLSKLEADYSYWINRGVSGETLKLLQGGVAREGRMKNRFVFPIFNSKDQIIGFSGRYVFPIPKNSKTPKWKHMGDKKEWKYPLKVNSKILKKNKKVVLVESIGDMLSLWEAGIRNVIVVFGLNVSTAIINTLISLDPNKIIIALNNDSSYNNAGNIAADKAMNKLRRYFDHSQLSINLPSHGDFGDMSKENIRLWAEGAQA